MVAVVVATRLGTLVGLATSANWRWGGAECRPLLWDGGEPEGGNRQPLPGSEEGRNKRAAGNQSRKRNGPEPGCQAEPLP